MEGAPNELRLLKYLWYYNIRNNWGVGLVHSIFLQAIWYHLEEKYLYVLFLPCYIITLSYLLICTIYYQKLFCDSQITYFSNLCSIIFRTISSNKNCQHSTQGCCLGIYNFHIFLSYFIWESSFSEICEIIPMYLKNKLYMIYI